MGWTVLTDVEEIVGDEGWDAAADFIEKMCEIYMKAVTRPPTLHECLASVEFVHDTTLAYYEEKQKQEAEDTSIDWDNIRKNLKAAGAIQGRFSVYSKVHTGYVSYHFQRNDYGGYDFKRAKRNE